MNSLNELVTAEVGKMAIVIEGKTIKLVEDVKNDIVAGNKENFAKQAKNIRKEHEVYHKMIKYYTVLNKKYLSKQANIVFLGKGVYPVVLVSIMVVVVFSEVWEFVSVLDWDWRFVILTVLIIVSSLIYSAFRKG